MSITFQFIEGLFVVAFTVLFIGAFVWLTIKHSDDAAETAVKWVITVPVLFFTYWEGFRRAKEDGLGALVALVCVLAGCICITIIWRRNLAGLVANPIASLYDGGRTPPDPHPAYSVAQGHQKNGRYLQAIAEIRKQLDRFPEDVEGHLMLAQIQAQDLKDRKAAEETINHLCSQPGHAPKNIVFALYSMADWHLAAKDLDAARLWMEKIGTLFPGSEFALGASQRIAHLAHAPLTFAAEDRSFAVPEGIKNLGLLRHQPAVAPPELSPEDAAAFYVKHLEAHPLDTEAREKLAGIYLRHYRRLDLASDQLEQMITQPNQPYKRVAGWLNKLADFQIEAGADYEVVRETLQRVVDAQPTFAPAEIARQRLARLKIELKGVEAQRFVQMGTYEQNLGLKSRRGLHGTAADEPQRAETESIPTPPPPGANPV